MPVQPQNSVVLSFSGLESCLAWKSVEEVGIPVEDVLERSCALFKTAHSGCAIPLPVLVLVFGF